VGKWIIIQEFYQTKDGSNTLYSKEYNQYFHDIKTGAILESLTKHVIPAFEFHSKFNKDMKHLKILDICFGLGYNTLATLYYTKRNNLNIKINIYSPEFDLELLNSLGHFQYPDEFQEFNHIIQTLVQTGKYQDKTIYIEIFNGDAREYIKTLKNIDIVYQDAFSSDVNHFLWTVEYFADISKLLNDNAIITTYSIATPIRLSIYKNDLYIYEYKPDSSNRITIALNKKQTYPDYKYIDMELKQIRNTTAKPLYD